MKAPLDPHFVQLFEQAVRRHGTVMIPLQISVSQLVSLVATLQMGVKHPDSPGGPQERLARSFIDVVAAELGKRDPAFQELIKLGWTGGFRA